MANPLSALKWINENRNRHDVRVREYAWPRKFGLPLYDYEITLTCETRPFSGRGQDENEGVAVAKALAECIERLHCGWNGLSSSGVAAHLSWEEASSHAQGELREHDAFFCHLLGGRLPDHVALSDRAQVLVDPFLSQGLTFEAYSNQTMPFSCVFAIAEDQVVAIGLGYGENSLERAIFEAMPNAANYAVNRNWVFERLTDWRRQALNRPRLRLTPGEGKVEFSEIFCPLSSPFKVVVAKSPEFQTYLGAGWMANNINQKRLTSQGLHAAYAPIGEKFF